MTLDCRQEANTHDTKSTIVETTYLVYEDVTVIKQTENVSAGMTRKSL